MAHTGLVDYRYASVDMTPDLNIARAAPSDLGSDVLRKQYGKIPHRHSPITISGLQSRRLKRWPPWLLEQVIPASSAMHERRTATQCNKTG